MIVLVLGVGGVISVILRKTHQARLDSENRKMITSITNLVGTEHRIGDKSNVSQSNRHNGMNAIHNIYQTVLAAIKRVSSTHAQSVHFQYFSINVDNHGDRLVFLWPSEWELASMSSRPLIGPNGSPVLVSKSPSSSPHGQGGMEISLPPFIHILAIGKSSKGTSMNSSNGIYQCFPGHQNSKTSSIRKSHHDFMEMIGGRYEFGNERLWGRWSLTLEMYDVVKMQQALNHIGTSSIPTPLGMEKDKSPHARMINSNSVGLYKTNSLDILLWSPDRSKKYKLTYRVDWWGLPNDKTPRHRIVPAFKTLEKHLISGFHFIKSVQTPLH